MEWLKNLFYDTNIDFVGKRRVAGTISLVMVILSWVAFFAIGPNWGIDFTGGTEIHLKFHEPIEIGEIRSGISELGLGGDAVQQIGSDEDHEFIVRIQDAAFGSEQFRSDVESRLAEAYGPDWIVASRFDAEVGARLTVEYAGDEVSLADVESHLQDIEGVRVQEGRDANQFVVKLPGLTSQVQIKLQEVLNKPFTVESTDAVGPKVGGELRRQGFLSIAATFGLVLLYVAFRFDIAFAPGAILALFHDVSVTVGIFVLLGRELNLPIIGALLTIVGYSLNDTIVIYDRIREHMGRYSRTELSTQINVSINETLSRTLATSVTTMMAMIAFLVLGGPVIQNFALAMMLGIVFGTYSTVFVASPTILVMQDVKPWLQRLVSGTTGHDEPPDDDDDRQPTDEALLTQSERRRRERARLEQQG